MNSPHDPAPPAMRAGGVSLYSGAENKNPGGRGDRPSIAAPMDMAHTTTPDAEALAPATRPVRVTPSMMTNLRNAALNRDGAHSTLVVLEAVPGHDGVLDASAVRYMGDVDESRATRRTMNPDAVEVVVLRSADPRASPVARLTDVPVGPLHPEGLDIVGLSTAAADALAALVAKRGVKSAWHLPRAAFREWQDAYGSAILRHDAARGPIWSLLVADAAANGYRLEQVPEPHGVAGNVRAGWFRAVLPGGGDIPFSFTDPLCPLCGQASEIICATFDRARSGLRALDYYTVWLVCPLHGPEPQVVEVVRERYVFMDAHDRDFGGAVMVDGDPAGIDWVITRDIATGIGHVVADPSGSLRHAEDDPMDATTVTGFNCGAQGQHLFNYNCGVDGFLRIPGHPEIAHLKTEDWEGREQAGGDEALAELAAMLGMDLSEGQDALQQAALDAMAALPPEQLAAWAERWLDTPNAFATREEAASDAWDSLEEWRLRMDGYWVVTEGRSPHYARLRAEASAAGRCLVIGADGAVVIREPDTPMEGA